jgi:hypothetical protein
MHAWGQWRLENNLLKSYLQRAGFLSVVTKYVYLVCERHRLSWEGLEFSPSRAYIQRLL